MCCLLRLRTLSRLEEPDLESAYCRSLLEVLTNTYCDAGLLTRPPAESLLFDCFAALAM